MSIAKKVYIFILCRDRIKNKRQSNEKELKSELDDLPPIEDLKISVSENLCDLVGEVSETPSVLFFFYIKK